MFFFFYLFTCAILINNFCNVWHWIHRNGLVSSIIAARVTCTTVHTHWWINFCYDLRKKKKRKRKKKKKFQYKNKQKKRKKKKKKNFSKIKISQKRNLTCSSCDNSSHRPILDVAIPITWLIVMGAFDGSGAGLIELTERLYL